MFKLRDDLGEDPWEVSRILEEPPAHGEGVDPLGKFSALPTDAARARSFTCRGVRRATHIYRDRPLILLRRTSLKQYSAPGQSEREFRIGLRPSLREKLVRQPPSSSAVAASGGGG